MTEGPELVSTEEAKERLADTEAFLDEIEAKRPTMNWDELVEEVEALRGDLD